LGSAFWAHWRVFTSLGELFAAVLQRDAVVLGLSRVRVRSRQGARGGDRRAVGGAGWTGGAVTGGCCSLVRLWGAGAGCFAIWRARGVFRGPFQDMGSSGSFWRFAWRLRGLGEVLAGFFGICRSCGRFAELCESWGSGGEPWCNIWVLFSRWEAAPGEMLALSQGCRYAAPKHRGREPFGRAREAGLAWTCRPFRHTRPTLPVSALVCLV
jgi:hypothetical protein